MNSILDSLSLYCPICGSGLLTSGHCKNRDCYYLLPDTNSIDISFKSQGIAKALSNICNYKFSFDNVECQSMESFIQSLRTPDVNLQEEICSMTGLFSYNIRTMLPDWRNSQKVYWRGIEIDRHSDEYSTLLYNAYYELYSQSAIFKYALDLTKDKGYSLIHTIGCHDRTLTLLSPNEFIGHLNHLRGC
ncbi:MAG: hypothetical protein IKV94_03225 [Clostridia bacterium]|nr:hypothetical protein [Clostridia bacterium]